MTGKVMTPFAHLLDELLEAVANDSFMQAEKAAERYREQAEAERDRLRLLLIEHCIVKKFDTDGHWWLGWKCLVCDGESDCADNPMPPETVIASDIEHQDDCPLRAALTPTDNADAE